MISRQAEDEVRKLAQQFKAVAVVGPRQSGKTTLVSKVFENKPYVNLENPDQRKYALEDPRGFLSLYPDGAVLDEVQRVPELFSYLQQILDESTANGKFILTGSNNFLLQEKISQSLAGRVGYLFLLPLSIEEIGTSGLDYNELIFKGTYPALYHELNMQANPSKYYANYIRTYVERDVRLIKNITDLYAFERLLRLCAGRIGQLLNMSSLAIEVGVDIKTIGSWISILETSFILFRLQPYHKNFNKRIVKMPKLYFYDTGVATALLGIENPAQLIYHPLRGSLFENLVILELLKKRYNMGKQGNIYFWRDNVGNEVDLIIQTSHQALPVEIKSGLTVTDEFFKGIRFWQKLNPKQHAWVVYAGKNKQQRSENITVLPLMDMRDLLDII
jgi:uncharacterized protein